MKGSDIIVNEIASCAPRPAERRRRSRASPASFRRAARSYDLTVPRGRALLGAAQPVRGRQRPRQLTYATEQGDPSHLRGLAGQRLRAGGGPRRDGHRLHADPARRRGRTHRCDRGHASRNEGEAAVEDVAVISRSGGVMVGTLQPGASETFTHVDRATSTGLRPPSRSTAFASGELDLGGGATHPGAPPGDRRPGRATAAPGPAASAASAAASIAVRSSSAGRWIRHRCRSRSTATRCSAMRRPSRCCPAAPHSAPGPVRIEPSQMVTGMVSTAGTVSEPEPGCVTIGEGEAVFQINLPLEATRHRPQRDRAHRGRRSRGSSTTTRAT